MKAQKILDSFNYAIEGIIHTVRTQRNMRFHMIAALLVLTVCFLYDLSKPELLAIVISISLVLTTELINTAIEFTIDLYTSNYHHLAKHAKNAAAAAVLVTALNAVVVGFIIFWKKLDEVNFILINKVRDSSPYTVFMVLVIVSITVVIVKAYYGKGTPLKGGMPSGHSALAFSLATALTLYTGQSTVFAMSFTIALIAAHSRIDSKVHSAFEVVAGAALGIVVTILLYKLFI
ncbi:MAG: diacylglycerol kinase [Clostridiaceae bacterium]